jgi:hypothetical protein
MYVEEVDNKNLLTFDKIISMEELCNELFPAIKNSKEDVVRATYQLNEILHSFGISEKVRGQFVGTCLLALKNGLEYKNSKKTAGVCICCDSKNKRNIKSTIG